MSLSDTLRSPHRSTTLSLGGSNESRRLKIEARENSRIMDDAYLSRAPMIYRNLHPDKAAFVDTAGHLHDIEHRPFPPIQKSSASHYPTRHPRHQPREAYWETFKPYPMNTFDPQDDDEHYAPGPSRSSEASVGAHNQLIPYEPLFGGMQRDHSVMLARISASGVDGRSGQYLGEGQYTFGEVLYEERAGRKQRIIRPPLTPKEKVRRTWIAAIFCTRLRIIRTQRWLRERV